MSLRILLSDGMRTWMRARGVWIVVLAALVPPLLTGSWSLTHQADVHPVDEITWTPGDPSVGDEMNITASVRNAWDTATGPFNITIQVGFFEPRPTGPPRFVERAGETFRIDGLAPGAEAARTLPWTAEGGTFIFRILADVDDELQEIEENNNDYHEQVQVAFPQVEADLDPFGARNGTATNGTADLATTDLRIDPPEVFAGDDANVTVTVANAGGDFDNATVTFQVYRVTATGLSSFPSLTEEETVDLAAGEERDVTFAWRPTTVGSYALVGYVDAGADVADDTSDNVRIQQYMVDRQFLYEEPEEKATAKAFYRLVLELLHLRLLIPLIALFYAAGVIEDERNRGNLPYLLTRPVPRWMLPVARSLQSFVLAGAAVAVGVVATFLLLLGLPQSAPGFLWFPLGFTLLALFAYGGLWTLLGVTVRRPTLWGLTYVLGVETLILLGRSTSIGGRPLLGDWVSYLSLTEWMSKALRGWDASEGTWTGGEATTALLVVILIGVGGIIAAAVAAQQREFPE